MRIAFEPLSPVNIHTDTSIWYFDQGIDVVKRVNHPSVGICIDSWNVWQTANLDEVIRQCGDRIFLVQLSDWKTPRSTADRYSLGDGEIPLSDIMASIRKTGFDGPWVVEILSSYHLPGSLWKENIDERAGAQLPALRRFVQRRPARPRLSVELDNAKAVPVDL